MLKYLSIFAISCFFLTSCSTKTVGTGSKTDVGIWQGKVQILGKKKRDRKWAYVTWASDSTQNKMRIDVRAILDVPVATYIRNETGAHLWLFTEGTYYHSKDAARLFSRLVKFSFNPDSFFNLLGNPQHLDGDWKCLNKKGLYVCQSKSLNAKVRMDHTENDRRIIHLEKGVKGLILKLSRSKVQVPPQSFEMLSKSQFKTFEI